MKAEGLIGAKHYITVVSVRSKQTNLY